MQNCTYLADQPFHLTKYSILPCHKIRRENSHLGKHFWHESTRRRQGFECSVSYFSSSLFKNTFGSENAINWRWIVVIFQRGPWFCHLSTYVHRLGWKFNIYLARGNSNFIHCPSRNINQNNKALRHGEGTYKPAFCLALSLPWSNCL